MMMHASMDDVTKQRMMQARALSKEAGGRGLNLGKKVSVPKDVQMEELNLQSNRGSRMFQERQRRVEKFTLENVPGAVYSANSVFVEPAPPPQIIPEPQAGKENQAFSIPGKHSLVMNLQKTIAKKGSPEVLAPEPLDYGTSPKQMTMIGFLGATIPPAGYAGPLKEIPKEKFNKTVIPKSYCSPWTEALRGNEELFNTLNTQLPELPQGLQPANYRCFNRSAMPFGGALASKRVIPVISYEAIESQNLPGIALDRMCQRPNFNRAPKGWGIHYNPESNEL